MTLYEIVNEYNNRFFESEQKLANKIKRYTNYTYSGKPVVNTFVFLCFQKEIVKNSSEIQKIQNKNASDSDNLTSETVVLKRLYILKFLKNVWPFTFKKMEIIKTIDQKYRFLISTIYCQKRNTKLGVNTSKISPSSTQYFARYI